MNAKLGRVENERYERGVGGVSQLDHPGGVTPLCPHGFVLRRA
jgi:hypothetical protein